MFRGIPLSFSDKNGHSHYSKWLHDSCVVGKKLKSRNFTGDSQAYQKEGRSITTIQPDIIFS